MTLTRTQGENALKHVVITVLNQPIDGPLMLSLTNALIDHINELMSINANDIEDLKYPTSDGTLSKIGPGHRGMLRCFCAFVRYRYAQSLPIGDDWTGITQEEFDEFRTSSHYDGTMFGISSVSNPGLPGLPSTPSTRPRDPVAEFKRGIKRDTSLFPVFKEDKQWDNWRRTTNAQGRAQDVAEVLDPTYTPTTAEDKALFKEKQTYMFAVFEKTLMTDQGKAYVREFEKEADAQSIYRRISEHALTSTKASIEASAILTYITSSKLGDGFWRGSTHSYCLNWQNQVRLYEDQVSTAEHFSDSQKRSILQNAVFSVPELRAVKTQADHLKTLNGQELKYPDYVKLLLSAAQTYDSSFVPKTPRRAVYNHDVTDPDYGDSDFVYDIDSRIDIIQANAHTRGGNQVNTHASASARPPGTRMALSKWNQLSQDAKDRWATLPDKDKAIILENVFGTGPLRHPFRQHADLHDVSAHNYLMANTHALRPESKGNVEDSSKARSVIFAPGEAVHDDDSTTLLDNVTRHRNMSEADLYKVLSTSISRYSGTGTKAKSASRSVNFAVHSSIPTHRSNNPGAFFALIDRRSNGGVAGQTTVLDHDALDPNTKKLRLDPLGGETSTPITKSRHDSNESGIDSNDGEAKEYHHTPVEHPSDLVSKTVLMDPQEDCQRLRTRIVRVIEDQDGETADNPTRVEFRCSNNDDESEVTIPYNKILNYVESNVSEETAVRKCKRISAPEGPLIRTHPNLKEHSYNVMIEWENGEITSEPLAADLAAVTCAIYGHSGRPPDEDKRETSGTLVDLVLTEAPTMVSLDKTYASSSSTMVGKLTFVALTSLFTLLIEAPMMVSLDNNYASSSTLVGMLTFVALASLFHRVRGTFAAEITAFYHVALGMLWDKQQVWKLLRPLRF